MVCANVVATANVGALTENNTFTNVASKLRRRVVTSSNPSIVISSGVTFKNAAMPFFNFVCVDTLDSISALVYPLNCNSALKAACAGGGGGGGDGAGGGGGKHAAVDEYL